MGKNKSVCAEKKCLMGKISYPIIVEGNVIGSIAEYRTFGILLLRKKEFYPAKDGVKAWDYYKPI